MNGNRDDSQELLRGIEAGDARALARALTWIENRDPRSGALMEGTATGVAALRVGITGAPGVGKSSVVARLIPELRAAGQRVAVLAVDPTSPVTGGAFLGDRLRMRGFEGDDGVYIRSLASRSGVGGIAEATAESLDLLERAGFDVLLVETVGVGQLELEVVEETDHVILLLSPEFGDMIQLLKSGAMEVVDTVVVNKIDRPGADELLRAAAEVSGDREEEPPLAVCAETGEGIPELAVRILASAADGAADGAPDGGRNEQRLQRRLRHRLRRRAEASWLRACWDRAGASTLEELAGRAARGETALAEAVTELTRRGLGRE